MLVLKLRCGTNGPGAGADGVIKEFLIRYNLIDYAKNL